jgi:hypothetical protein
MTAIIRRNPAGAVTVFGPSYHPFRILDEVDTIARNMFESGGAFSGAGIVHGMDVYREKDDIVVKAEMPVSGRRISISASKKTSYHQGGKEGREGRI